MTKRGTTRSVEKHKAACGARRDRVLFWLAMGGAVSCAQSPGHEGGDAGLRPERAEPRADSSSSRSEPAAWDAGVPAPDAALARSVELENAPGASETSGCLPSCITRLQAACRPGEVCVVTYQGLEQSVCWDNGVRQRNAFTLGDQGNLLEVWVRDGAGQACFSVSNALPSEGPESFTWYDSAARPVAKGVAVSGAPSVFEVTCLETGEESTFDRASAACANFADGAFSALACDVGECAHE